MLENIFIFAISIFLIIKGATLSTKYAFQMANDYKLSKFIVGFIVIAVISIIPEIFISINSALAGVPSLGLGTLFGGNVADMTLVFAIIIFFVGRGIKVESRILKENIIYPFILIIPIVLGFDGYYSRWEGLGLIFAGLVFYYLTLKNNNSNQVIPDPLIENSRADKYKNTVLLILSMFILLLGSRFIVSSAIGIADYIGISSTVIGMLIIGVGTTMPELFFCLAAIRKNHDSIAIGDILGTVLADATVVVGILALISPFYFPLRIVYSTGVFMIASSFILFYFMRTGRFLSKNESYLLLSFWLLFVIVEIILNV